MLVFEGEWTGGQDRLPGVHRDTRHSWDSGRVFPGHLYSHEYQLLVCTTEEEQLNNLTLYFNKRLQVPDFDKFILMYILFLIILYDYTITSLILKEC